MYASDGFCFSEKFNSIKSIFLLDNSRKFENTFECWSKCLQCESKYVHHLFVIILLFLCFPPSLSLIFADDFSNYIQCQGVRVNGKRKEKKKDRKNTFSHLNIFLIGKVSDFEIGFVQFTIIWLLLSFSVGSHFIVGRTLLLSLILLSTSYLDFGVISIHHCSREIRLVCTGCMEHKFNDTERKIWTRWNDMANFHSFNRWRKRKENGNFNVECRHNSMEHQFIY